jgi:hypothetical protein
MPGPAFGPSQWAYRENAIVAAPEMAASPVTATRWATADGSVAAAYIGGQLEVGPWAWPVGPSAANLSRERPAGLGDEISKVPLDLPALSYGSLSSLPGDPAEIIGILAGDLVASDEAWLPGRAFEKIAGLFLDYVMPPAVAAQIYRALGAIPGVTADAAAIDAAGVVALVSSLPDRKAAISRSRSAQRITSSPDTSSSASAGTSPLTSPGVRPS